MTSKDELTNQMTEIKETLISDLQCDLSHIPEQVNAFLQKFDKLHGKSQVHVRV